MQWSVRAEGTRKVKGEDPKMKSQKSDLKVVGLRRCS